MIDNLVDLLNKILGLMESEGASDCYLKAECKPMLRIEGDLVPVDIAVMTPAVTENIAFSIMPPYLREHFDRKPEANFMYQIPGGKGRFRVNAYKERGALAMVFRRIRDDIRNFEELGLPSVLAKLAMDNRGLVLITGPTGSGKSTTLASIIDYRNKKAPGHIVTIEDPIEFLHYDHRSIVSQREVGSDTACFQDALESALRQAPDVLLVGEMRDMESVKAAVFFAETGHLVFSTLHSSNAYQTVERVMQFFPSTMHEQVLHQLAMNLKAVVSQRLVPRADGTGQVAAVEIMIVNARMQELVKHGEFTQIMRELDEFIPEGMQSFDHALLQYYREGIISAEDAMKTSDNPNDMRLKIKTLPDYIKSSGREDDRYAEDSYDEAVAKRKAEAAAAE
ncbi:MAG: PilT/PilU family type 4a pilus ATPase [bacterium]